MKILGNFLIGGLLLMAAFTTSAGQFELKSSAFQEGTLIPKKYTCDGQEVSPQLQWSFPPSNTQSFVLIVDDPDAPMGTYDHWIVFNIPATTHQFEENIVNYPPGAIVATNSAKTTRYKGPCPPSKTHRYFFKLYALDKTLDLKSSATKKDILAEIKDHILGEAVLMGRYTRE